MSTPRSGNVHGHHRQAMHRLHHLVVPYDLHGRGPRQTCPRALVGRRCRLPLDATCICADPMMRHRKRWVTTTGHHVLTAEPYAVTGLGVILQRLAALTLDATVHDDTAWPPGAATLIMMRPTAGPNATPNPALHRVTDDLVPR